MFPVGSEGSPAFLFRCSPGDNALIKKTPGGYTPLLSLAGPNNQQGADNPVQDARSDTTVKNTGKSAAVAGHGNEVGIFFFGGLDNPFHRRTIGHPCLRVNVFLAELFRNSLQVGFGLLPPGFKIFFAELDSPSGKLLKHDRAKRVPAGIRF
jgi:hypothetical protein